VSEDYADLFCGLFDGIDPAEFRANREAWLADPRVNQTAAQVETAVLAGDSVETAHPFAALLGIDAALAHANPLLGGPAPAVLSEFALRYAEAGRFDSGNGPGALLPRFARPGRGAQLPDDLADAFGAVVRVRGSDWEACDHLTLPAHARLTRADREVGLRVATTPMIREPDELHWEVDERGGRRFYRIHPTDAEATRRRIERVIAGWDERDVTIGVAPELCLSPALLESWQAGLRDRKAAGTSRLRMVIPGTGNVASAAPPVNSAMLLDGRTGEVLVGQSKVHPFNFSESDLALWGLHGRFQAPIDEDLRCGERVCVMEAGGGRLAILVCEDLARLHTFAAALHGHGVSLILVPVFARPTKDRRWERSRAEVYCDAIGSSVIVANSLVIASILRTPAPVGTAIAVAPGEAVVGHASEPDDVVVFSLEGGAPRLAHEPMG
jgi:predicted amidohydrolase